MTPLATDEHSIVPTRARNALKRAGVTATPAWVATHVYEMLRMEGIGSGSVAAALHWAMAHGQDVTGAFEDLRRWPRGDCSSCGQHVSVESPQCCVCGGPVRGSAEDTVRVAQEYMDIHRQRILDAQTETRRRETLYRWIRRDTEMLVELEKDHAPRPCNR